MSAIKPVTPSDVMKPPDVSASVAVVNEALSRPWANYERNTGRHLATKLLGEFHETVAEEFRKAGWDVSFHDDQRDGAFYTFRRK